VKRLDYPFMEKDVRGLVAGDTVLVSGIVHTGRDRFHKHFADGGRIPVDFRNGALFHCGPVVVEKGGKWKGCFHVPRGLFEIWQILEKCE